MKVYIGPYKKWIGPYHIFGWTEKFLSDETYQKLTSFVQPFFEWLDSKRQRKMSIHIDNYDTWSMDHTLALIVSPMLKQLKETKHGSPKVDDCDVPKELRASSAKAHEVYEIDEHWHERWKWVLEEMIFAFDAILKNEDHEDSERIDKGLKLFGKYYRGLWD